MNSNHRSLKFGAPLLVAAASLAVSPPAWSLGLGEARVESYLNQPLRARIDLITQESDDLASVTARLASARDYELIGASRDTVSVPLRFSVEDIDGDAYILATSNLPVSDPVVRLIVEVNWSSGRMLREYTLFLDPPTVPATAPAPRIDQRPSAAAAPAAAPVPAPTEPAAPAQPAAVTAGGEYGPVRSGQTLWSIASEWSRGSGLDINRVMIAIQRDNPDAFLNGNINLLKRGAILRMPEVSDVESIPAAVAYREVAQQEEAFTGQAAPATVASPETPLLASEAAPAERPAEPEPAVEPVTPAEADEPASVAEDTPDTSEPEVADEAAAPPQDMLELVPPSAETELDSAYGLGDTDEEAGVEAADLRESLARTEEELINQQQQNAYLEERIRELESQLESTGTEGVADADMANMEARLQAQRQAEAEARAQRERAAETPWYGRWWLWLVGLLVVVAAIVGWLRSRRGQLGVEGASATSEDSLRDIKSEAEDVLRVLAEDDRKAAEATEATADADADAGGEAAGTAAAEDAAGDEAAGEEQAAPRRFSGGVDDAELLDEESSDPEIQLDLARAYISMGDKEAARVILEEVVNNGTETQQGEARKMLDLLT